MTTFVTQSVVANELTGTVFAKIILLAIRFLAIFLYLCALAIGTIKGYFYLHNPKVTLYLLIAKFLLQHTFYNTTQFFRAATNPFDITTIFTCRIASELRPEITEADIRRIPDADLRRLATALYNGTYNTNFRVGRFRPFQDPRIRAAENMSMAWSMRDNPTGIFVERNEEVVIMVGETNGQEIQIVIQDLDYGWGANRMFPLFEGINRLRMPMNGLIYVMNLTTADIPLILETAEDKAKAAAKTVDIHFVFGQIQGYFSSARHTNADWIEMLRNARHYYIDIVGVYAHITWAVSDFRRYNTTDIIGILRNFDELVYQQQVFVGLQKFNRMYRNRMYFYRALQEGGAYAAQFRTGYGRNVGERIARIERFVPGIWPFGHEVGHMTQLRPSFTWHTMGEISVNVYTKYNQRRFGGNPALMAPSQGFPNHYALALYRIVDAGIPHACPTIENRHFERLVPFWQLHLYLVEAQGQTNFWKYLHEHFRVTPVVGGGNHGLIQLDFVRQVSRISGLNMVEFFQTWGLLTPIHRATGTTFTITQADIDLVINDVNNMGLPAPPHTNIHLIRDDNIDDFR